MKTVRQTMKREMMQEELRASSKTCKCQNPGLLRKHINAKNEQQVTGGESFLFC